MEISHAPSCISACSEQSPFPPLYFSVLLLFGLFVVIVDVVFFTLSIVVRSVAPTFFVLGVLSLYFWWSLSIYFFSRKIFEMNFFKSFFQYQARTVTFAE
jgi:hypothetical protein